MPTCRAKPNIPGSALRNVHFIAIVGGSGSGKSWLAERLLEQFGAEAGRLALDDFYLDLSHLPFRARKAVNFDHPRAIDWALFLRTLTAIRRGRSVHLPQYNFRTHTRRVRQAPWKPCRLVILDGLWLLRRAEVRQFYSLSVFVECSEDLRLRRRIQRDQRERGRSVESICAQVQQQVLPMHRRFVASQASRADLVVDASRATSGLTELTRRCRRLLKEQGTSGQGVGDRGRQGIQALAGPHHRSEQTDRAEFPDRSGLQP